MSDFAVGQKVCTRDSLDCGLYRPYEVAPPGVYDGWVRLRLPDGTSDWFPADDYVAANTSLFSTGPIRTPPIDSKGHDDLPRMKLNEALLRRAATADIRVKFTYRKPNGSVDVRHLEPSEVFESESGQLLVVGYDDDRDELRAFRLDRIEDYVTAA